IPARLRIMKLNLSAQIRLDTVSENCIFYISTTYEFSHGQGPRRKYHLGERQNREPCGTASLFAKRSGEDDSRRARRSVEGFIVRTDLWSPSPQPSPQKGRGSSTESVGPAAARTSRNDPVKLRMHETRGRASALPLKQPLHQPPRQHAGDA